VLTKEAPQSLKIEERKHINSRKLQNRSGRGAGIAVPRRTASCATTHGRAPQPTGSAEFLPRVHDRVICYFSSALLLLMLGLPLASKLP